MNNANDSTYGSNLNIVYVQRIVLICLDKILFINLMNNADQSTYCGYLQFLKQKIELNHHFFMRQFQLT